MIWGKEAKKAVSVFWGLLLLCCLKLSLSLTHSSFPSPYTFTRLSCPSAPLASKEEGALSLSLSHSLTFWVPSPTRMQRESSPAALLLFPSLLPPWPTSWVTTEVESESTKSLVTSSSSWLQLPPPPPPTPQTIPLSSYYSPMQSPIPFSFSFSPRKEALLFPWADEGNESRVSAGESKEALQ